MNETERIKGVYDKRKEVIPKDWYTYFNRGNLFIIQQRQRKMLQLLDKYGMNPLEDKKILDVGCGGGGELRNLLQYGAKPENLFGIDLLEERVEFAKKLSPNINFYCGNAQKLPCEDETFDIVMQFTLFTSILDFNLKSQIAQEMLRV